jgi:hypothetical protein
MNLELWAFYVKTHPPNDTHHQLSLPSLQPFFPHFYNSRTSLGPDLHYDNLLGHIATYINP